MRVAAGEEVRYVCHSFLGLGLCHSQDEGE